MLCVNIHVHSCYCDQADFWARHYTTVPQLITVTYRHRPFMQMADEIFIFSSFDCDHSQFFFTSSPFPGAKPLFFWCPSSSPPIPPLHTISPSLYCPSLCFPFYLTNPGFSSFLLAFTPFLVISYPFVWTDPYLLSPATALVSFLLFLHLMTLIFSFSLYVSYFLPHYLCLFIYSSIYRHLSTFSTTIWHLTIWIF